MFLLVSPKRNLYISELQTTVTPGALKQMIWSPRALKFSSWSHGALPFLARSPGAHVTPFETLLNEDFAVIIFQPNSW